MTILKNRVAQLIIVGIVSISMLVVLTSSVFAQRGGDENLHVASAILMRAPQGHATVHWDGHTKDLTVTVTLTGLAPSSTHPEHIHTGACSTNGPILFPLNDVMSNAGGDARTTTVIHNVQAGIPQSGWFINVHNGPTLGSADEAAPITCGDIRPTSDKDDDVQNAFVVLGDSIAPNQHSFGTAALIVKNGSLVVVVAVSGLVPGSMHAEHIHVGSCESQVPGNVIFPLTTLVADSSGNAVATTVIPNVTSIPEHGWYINIHRVTALGTQTGFDPIACGDVRG